MEALLDASKLLVMSCTNGHHQLGINLSLNNASTWIHIMAHVHLHIQMSVYVYRQRKSCSVYPSPCWGCLGWWNVSPSSVRWVSLHFPKVGGAVATGSCKKKLPCFCLARVPYYHNNYVSEYLISYSFPSVNLFSCFVTQTGVKEETQAEDAGCWAWSDWWLVNTAVLQQAEIALPGKLLVLAFSIHCCLEGKCKMLLSLKPWRTVFEVLDLREDSESNHDICLKGHL